MRKKKRLEITEEPMVNLTPLIDVVFVILFTFIVVAPLLEIDHIDLASGPPASGQNSAEETSPIAIHVFADDAITFNKEYVSLDELETRLQIALAQFPKATPQLFHDKKATFGTYQSVKNAVESAGFSQMDVILKPN